MCTRNIGNIGIGFPFDEGIIGCSITLACIALLKFWSYESSYSSLVKLRLAKTVPLSGLQQLLSSSAQEKHLVVVRGFIQVHPKLWLSTQPNFLVSSPVSGKVKGIALQRTEAATVHKEWKGDSLGWISYLKDVSTSSTNVSSFILAQRKNKDNTGSGHFVDVNLRYSTNPLPLTTVYNRLQSVESTYRIFPFLKCVFGLGIREKFYPVPLLGEPGLLEEKMLPLGKEISVVGNYGESLFCTEISPCDDLPYFLSDLTKDQMVVELSHKTNCLFWSAIIFGSLSLGVLGCYLTRPWLLKWWEQRRQIQQSRRNREHRQAVQQARRNWERRQVLRYSSRIDVQQRQQIQESRRTDGVDGQQGRQVNQPRRTDDDADDEVTEDITLEHLCVICLTRKRRTAFLPCGHFVSCCTCAPQVLETHQCPVCRQTINSSARIFS